MKCRWLAEDSVHSVWLAREQSPPLPEEPWKDVVRANPITFTDWLICLPFRGGDTDKVSALVLTATNKNQINDETPEGVFEFAWGHPELERMIETIRALETEWRIYTNSF